MPASPNSSIQDFDLRLPPITPPLPSDEAVVHTLARSDIRAGLDEVNSGITTYLRGLEDQGLDVTEKFRGITAERQRVVAVAEYASPEDGSIAPGSPAAAMGKLCVFAFQLDQVTTDAGREAALRPVQVADQHQISRAHTIHIVTLASGVKVELELRPGGQPPLLSREEVIPFNQAAFGERRIAAAERATEWIIREGVGLMRGDFSKGGAITAYRDRQLAELYANPAWFDNADPLDGISDDALKEVARLTKQDATPTQIRIEAARYARELGLVHPDDVAVLRDAMTIPPDPADTSLVYSYFRDQVRRPNSIAAIVAAARQERLKAALIIAGR